MDTLTAPETRLHGANEAANRERLILVAGVTLLVLIAAARILVRNGRAFTFTLDDAYTHLRPVSQGMGPLPDSVH